MAEHDRESSQEASKGGRRADGSPDVRSAGGSQMIGRLFGQRLTAARERCQQSQDEMSAQTGLSAESIALIERGEANPTLATMVELSKAVGEDPWRMIARY